MKYVGRVEVRLHIFVSLELDGGEWSGTQSGSVSLKTRYGRGAQPQYSTVKKMQPNAKRYPGKIYSKQRNATRHSNVNLNTASDYSTMQVRQRTDKAILRRVRVTKEQ